MKAILLELLDDVSDRVLLYRVGLDDGQCALQCFHKLGYQVSGLNQLNCRDGACPVSLRGRRRGQPRLYTPAPSAAASVSPISAGDFATLRPAFSMAAIFSAAVPLPPEIIAPAWPMRRPGGAVCPAINPTTGFFICILTNSAAVSSALPPISPIMITASVCGSRLNKSSASTKLVPISGSPPMPIAVDCPMPRCVSWCTASYVSVPERDTIPTLPSLWIDAGMIPILHLPGEMMPGQFGPIRRERRFWRNSQARTMSSVGMPSVMQTINSISASAAYIIASAANGGGTKMTVAFAPVFSAASWTVLKIGQPSCVVPPLPGVTPPTICVP